MSNEKEAIWKSYPDYPFLQANQFGEIRIIDRTITRSNGQEQFVRGHVLKQYHDHYGYLYVQFYVNGKRITLKSHRIVATCFIPNPDNLPQVNHIDCNRSNNVVSNLEWCTNQYNTAYREKYGKAAGHPVFAVNVKTGEVLHFESRGEAERKLNISHQDIFAVIKGQMNTIHDYWFTEDESKITEEKIRELRANMRLTGGVIAINLRTQSALYFESQKEAGRCLNISQSSISNVARGNRYQIKDYWFCCADENAVEKSRVKFGDEIAEKVEKLISENKKF